MLEKSGGIGVGNIHVDRTCVRTKLDELRSFMKFHDLMLKDVRGELADVLGDKSFLVIDAALGKAAERVERFLGEFQKFDEDIGEYVSRTFFPEGVNSSADIYRSFFGPGINVKTFDLSNIESGFNFAPAPLIYTGSPANISMLGQGGDHDLVFGALSKVNDEAIAANLPVLGICYGHQFIMQKGGVNINRLPTLRGGFESIDHQANLPNHHFNADSPSSSVLWVCHGDYAEGQELNNGVVFSTATTESNLVIPHAAAVINGYPPNCKTIAMEEVRQAAEDGLSTALTTQAHPEQTAFFHMLKMLNYNIDNISSALAPPYDIVESIRRQLAFFKAFLENHAMFRRPKEI